ncbi:MAG: hypothetical protein MJ082_04930, partial [Clostridia bacterium]|nr:hypothetical protein [Clostridia bacterium]
DLFARHPSAILASSADAYDAELKNAVAEVAPDLLFDFLYVPSSEGQAPLTETDKNGTRKPFHGLLAHRPIPAFPTYEGWKTVLSEDQQNPFSAMADYRNPKGAEGQAKIISALSERGLAPYSAAQTCFATGVRAADEYTRAYSAFRAEKKDGVGFLCGIAREPWCSVGNALIDGKGNRRALYYAVKRSQGNVTLYAQRAGWRIGFTVENRRQTPYTGTVVASVTDAGNHVISKSQFNVTVPPMSVGQTESVDFSTIVFGKESEYFVSASVGDTAADSETFVYFCEPKCFALLQPTVTVSVSGGGKEFDLSVRSDVFVPNAEFSVSGVIADFDDNGFALTKVAPYRVHLTTAIPMTVEALCEKLSLITTYDVGRIQQTQLKIN